MTEQVTSRLPPNGQADASWLPADLGFVPGMIRVGEFRGANGTGGLSLHHWPQQYVNDYLQHPFVRPAGMSDRAWNGRGGVLRRWLHEGRFVIEWDGKDFWADSRGRIFSS